ncbi:MAG: aminopeptidase P family protein [Bacteroidota bacterium]
MFKSEVYQQRRNLLKNEVKSGLILLMGNEESSINFKHNVYKFRQDSTFLYFLGLDRPNLIAIIDLEKGSEIIFGDDPGIDDTVFLGSKESLSDLCAQSGISTVRPSDSIIEYLKGFKGEVHFLPQYRPENLLKISQWLNLPVQTIKASPSKKLIKAVVAQRSIKSDKEVAEIERAVDLTVDMQMLAIENAREGMTEAQIAAKMESLVYSQDCMLSFPTILTVDGHILHNYNKGNKLRNGQMLLIDCGAENQMHYAGDLTRTIPIGSGFTSQQNEIYEIIKAAHDAAVEALKPGKRFLDIHLLACEKLADGLKNIGLMKGDIKEAVAMGAHTMFFQCGLGHMMGLDVHDMEDLGEAYVGYTEDLLQSTQFGLKSVRLGRAVEPGFVLTIEPGSILFHNSLICGKPRKNIMSLLITKNLRLTEISAELE